MSALEEIFDSYYENQMDKRTPDPKEMQKQYAEISRLVEYTEGNEGGKSCLTEILERASLYGREAEKRGFIAGFKMGMRLAQELA